ncbi:MAG: thiamine-phosphate kinase [Pseudohongiellaceae bacterium]
MNKPGSQAEFEIIRRHFSKQGLAFARDGIELGIGDDAALIALPADKQLAMSMDVLVAGVHFPADGDPALIANRALAVNLSDLAAMAAQPYCFTLGLVLPHVDEDWLQDFSAGLEPLARRYNCPLVGGDTSSGPLSISIQVQGLVNKNAATRRSGARVGDKIFVSGTLGDAAIALLGLGQQSHLGAQFCLSVDKMSAASQNFFSDAFYKPQPQIELALAAGKLFSSCIDISDGLHGDLQHILERSHVGAKIQIDAIPYSESALSCVDADNRVRAALFGGDDYGLCFTIAEQDCSELQRLADELGVQTSCIGAIIEGEDIVYLDADQSPVRHDAEAFQHFNTSGVN